MRVRIKFLAGNVFYNIKVNLWDVYVHECILDTVGWMLVILVNYLIQRFYCNLNQ